MTRSTARRAIAALAALATTAWAGPGFAQGTSAQRAACTPDVFRFCAGDIPNVGKIVACLRKDKLKLSGACRDVFDSLDEQRISTRSARRDAGDDRQWCDFGASASGQEVWMAWCANGSRN